METIAGDVVVEVEEEILNHKQQNENSIIKQNNNIAALENNNVNNVAEEELLGSVTTYLTDGPTVRTSARVIHKLRMDNTPLTQSEKKETQSETVTVNLPKTPSQSKPPHVKVQWVNSERNFFFDALNEYGRDFEQISRFINAKMKRKMPSDQDYKTKENIRQLYYQFYAKASKYLRFSDEIKKFAQELYTLINYGEMKRKLVMSSEKSFLKLRELVYKGVVTIRIKGKNIKVKTPSCRALRKLNQLEGNAVEDVQLPQRVDVILRPVNMKSWGYVQTLAQNPRIRMVSLPLQKRLASLLHTMQQKWQTGNSRLYEKYVSSCIQRHGAQKIGDEIITQSQTDTAQMKNEEPVLRFMPPRDTVIHRPMVQLNEMLSSYNLCLNSYEERIGAKTRGENLCTERIAHIKDLLKHSSKRLRNDSASEKSAKVAKVESTDEIVMSVIDHKSNDSNDVDVKKIEEENLDVKKEEVDDILMSPVLKLEDEKPPTQTQPPIISGYKSKKKEAVMIGNKQLSKELTFKPLIDEEMLKKIRTGWTIATVGDLTIGDLYLMFGSDSRLVLEYDCMPSDVTTPEANGEVSECKIENKIIGNKLKNLISIANLMEGTTNPLLTNYFAGHACDKPTNDSSDALFKQPVGPRTSFDALNRTVLNMNPRIKAHQSRWWQQHRPRPLGNQIVAGVSANHVIRDLYQTPPSVESQTNKKQSDKDEEVTKIIEDKIQNISGTMTANNYSENSRSSMRSLLECFSSNDLPNGASIGDGE